MSPRPVDLKVVGEHLAYLAQVLADLRKLPAGSLEELEADWKNFPTAESLVRRAVECVIDIARHVLRTCAGALALAALACTAPEDSTEPAPAPPRASAHDLLTENVDRMVTEKMRTEHLPGVALVIVENGRTIYERGYGVANLATGKPVDPGATIFRIGSVTKVLTSLVVARLADRGQLSFDDDVTRYLTGVPMMGDFERPVTVMNLVTHTGGFDQIGMDRQIRPFDLPLAERRRMRPSLKEFLAAGNLRRVTPPGAMFRYDTYGITLAGLVIEEVTGEPFAVAMEREMFAPLGMTRSSVEVDDDLRSDLAMGYGYLENGYVEQPYEVYVTTPASSVDATAGDMGRLLAALTNDGANDHGRWLSSAAARAATAPQYRPHPDFVGSSHGFREVGWPAHAFSHGGSMLGFSSKLVVLPELGLGYFVATNRDIEAGGGPVTLLDELVFAILESLTEPRPPAPNDVPDVPVERDVSRYLGKYVDGVYCRTCSPADFERGAWPASPGVEVTSPGPGIVQLFDKLYVSKGDGLFVRDDGRRQLMFGQLEGKVLFLALSDSPVPMERAPV